MAGAARGHRVRGDGLVSVEAVVQRPGIVLIDERQQAGKEKQVDELGVKVVPLLDGGRAEDEQDHNDGAGDKRLASEEAE